MEPNLALKQIIAEYGREMENLWNILPGGMFNPLESMALYSLIRHQRPKTILEVGSLLGRSTCIIQQAVEYNGNTNFFTCDLYEKSVLTKRNVDRIFPENKTVFLQHGIEQSLSDIPDDVDFIFLDGPHTYDFMVWCFENLLPKVITYGHVLIHDVNLSFDWNYRDTPGCETEYLISLKNDGKLPLIKMVWLEDWCLNHHFRELRNSLYDDFTIIGKWGILNPPEMNSLSIWVKTDA